MLCIISPYAAVYAHGAHRVGRHGARGKHLRHSCDLWAWWCCLRCYCWLGCQWRDGRRPLAPLQQRLLRRGKIRISCPEPADTWPHICIYTTSVWAAQAKPRSSQLATVWLLAVVSHSWCTSSQQGRLITIVTRREKSSICEITLLQLAALGRSRHGRACEAPVPPVKPMLSPLPPSRFARHLASPQGSSLAPSASLRRSPAPAPPTSCTATRDAPPSRTACIRYSRRAFATTWIACHCKRARSRAVKVCRAG